jgi:sulfur carrier protein
VTGIELNGAPVEVADGTTLVELIEQRTGTTRGSAVVVDGAIVPRSAWSSYEVAAGQHIELITAVQGG